MNQKIEYTDEEAAQAVVDVIPGSRWIVAAFAHGYLAMLEGEDDEKCARIIFDRKPGQSLTKSRKMIEQSKSKGFLKLLPKREDTGSAENPITKMFPATITEHRFIEELDILCNEAADLDYEDDRKSGHTYSDFTLIQKELHLPINTKNHGTRFRSAESIVGLHPDDCLPISAYKAHGALDQTPDLLYAISVDYDLSSKLDALLPTTLDRGELIVWNLLNKYKGALAKNAEDLFIFTTVQNRWSEMKKIVLDNPFNFISARKAIKILQDKPKRTPGIGIKAWGTKTSGEVNVHISIKDETIEWDEIKDRILNEGIADIIKAVNKKTYTWIYDPEI